MSEIVLVDMTDYGPSEGKSSLGPVGTVAGIAVAIAVPFLAPTVAGAIFGSSVIAGSLGWLAVGATGAALGAAGAALTGNDWLTGALLGGVGAAGVQALGGFGAVSAAGEGLFGPVGNGLFGAGVAAATPNAALQGGAGGAGIAGGFGATQAAPGGFADMGLALGAGAGGTAAPAAGGLGATLGNILKIDPSKLVGPMASAAVTGLSALGSELLPPSDEALANDARYKEQAASVDQQIRDAKNMDPDYYAQNAANAARLRTAAMLSEGKRGLDTSGYHPQASASADRRAAVAGSEAAGSEYYRAWIAADADRTGRAANANAAYAGLATGAQGGTAEERRKRAEDLAEVLGPFAAAYAPATSSAQVTKE